MNARRSTTAIILLLSFHSASAMIGEDAYVAFERDARAVGKLLPDAKRLPR